MSFLSAIGIGKNSDAKAASSYATNPGYDINAMKANAAKQEQLSYANLGNYLNGSMSQPTQTAYQG